MCSGAMRTNWAGHSSPTGWPSSTTPTWGSTGARPPSIRLLPIETRARDGSVAEFKNYADEWVTLALDLSSADKMSQVLSQVSQTKRIPVALARKYGLYDDDDVLAPLSATDEAAVDRKRRRVRTRSAARAAALVRRVTAIGPC